MGVATLPIARFANITFYLISLYKRLNIRGGYKGNLYFNPCYIITYNYLTLVTLLPVCRQMQHLVRVTSLPFLPLRLQLPQEKDPHHKYLPTQLTWVVHHCNCDGCLGQYWPLFSFKASLLVNHSLLFF